MIPDQVFEQLSSGAFDKVQAIVVMKMLLVTAEHVRAQVRAEFRQELSGMRADYGRLIIEAVEATEARIFARLEQEAKAVEEKKRVRREAAAARRKEREAARAAPAMANQTGFFDSAVDEAVSAPVLMDGGQGGLVQGGLVQGGLVQEAGLPRRRAGQDAVPDEVPTTAPVAAKFEDNPEFKALMEQWERQAASSRRARPTGSPIAAVADLGKAIVAGLEREERGEVAGMIGHAPDEQQVEPVADVMLQAAE